MDLGRRKRNRLMSFSTPTLLQLQPTSSSGPLSPNGYAATGLGGATNKNENHPADRVMVPISAV
jgi:hypothetical protein